MSFTWRHGPPPLHNAPRDKGCYTQAVNTFTSCEQKQNDNMTDLKLEENFRSDIQLTFHLLHPTVSLKGDGASHVTILGWCPACRLREG